MTRLWPLVLSTVALGINSYVIAGILPSIAVSLRTSQGAVGLGVTAFTAAYALTAPWLPGLLTRTGTTRRALSTALTVFTAGSAITALSPSPHVFLVARAVAGVGAGALTALATGAAGAMMPGRRDRAMATITLGLSLGTVAGVPVGMLIAGRVGWRAAMGLIVVLGLVALAALAARGAAIPDLPRPARSNRSNRPNRPEGTAEGARDPRIPAGRARIRRRTAPVLAGGVVLAFLLGVASLGLYTYLLPIAAGAGLSGLGFALVWAWGIGGVAGSWSAGRLLGRIPGRRLLPLPRPCSAPRSCSCCSPGPPSRGWPPQRSGAPRAGPRSPSGRPPSPPFTASARCRSSLGSWPPYTSAPPSARPSAPTCSPTGPRRSSPAGP